MSTQLLLTSAARWQLRAAVESIRRADVAAATRFVTRLDGLSKDPKALTQCAKRVSEIPESPFREVTIEGYRVFFRTQSDTVWIAGIWTVQPEGHAGQGR